MINQFFYFSKSIFELSIIKLSIIFSIFIEILVKIYKLIINRYATDDNIIYITVMSTLLFLAVIVSLWDLFTGIKVSKKNGEKIISNKFSKTVIKFQTILGIFALGLFTIILTNSNIISVTIVYSVIFLVIIREYISIGENYEKKNGYKPYFFTLIEKIFQILEIRLLDYFNSNLFKGKKNKKNED